MKTKKRKTIASKILALCLAVVMLMGMSVTAFAEITENSTGKFTVMGFETDATAIKAIAYKIIDVQVENGQPEYPMYTWANSSIAQWAKKQDESYVDVSIGTLAVGDAFKDMPAAQQTIFLEKLAAAIKNNEITGLTATEVTVENGEAQFDAMPMGEYLILASGGVKIYQPTSVKLVPVYNEQTQDWDVGEPDVGVEPEHQMKSVEPGIGKEATTKGNDKMVAIGDTVTYVLTVTVPSYPEDATNTTFIVGDALSQGLTFNNDIEVYSDEALETLILATSDDGTVNYTVETEGLGKGRTFKVSFTEEFTKEYPYTTLYITYTATVNANAFEQDALGNKAFLGYDNDPYSKDSYTEKPVEEKVYTYGIEIKKVDKEGNPLEGAQFVLVEGETELTFTETEVDGVYNYDPKSDNKTLEVSADGILKIQGLDVGTYTLKEIKAPNDYVLPTHTITIVIEDRQEVFGVLDNSSATSTGETIVIKGGVDIEGNLIKFNIQNISSDDADFDLPATGGMGTMIFTVAGILLMGGAVALVVVAMKKRKSN